MLAIVLKKCNKNNDDEDDDDDDEDDDKYGDDAGDGQINAC